MKNLFRNSNQISKFIPFSPLEPTSKDISLYVKTVDMNVNDEWTRLNQFYKKIRELSGMIGEIKQIG